MTRDDTQALAGAAGLAGLALFAAHHALWNTTWERLKWARPLNYVIGLGTINAAFSWYAWRRGQASAAGALWLISAAGGLAVGAGWLSHVPGAWRDDLTTLLRLADDGRQTWDAAWRYAQHRPDPSFRQEGTH